MAQTCRLGLLLALLWPVVGASMPSTVVRLNKAMLSYGKRGATVLSHVCLSRACASESMSACMYNSKRVHVPMNSKAPEDPDLTCHCAPGSQTVSDTVLLNKYYVDARVGRMSCPICKCAHMFVLAGLSGVGMGQFGNFCLCVSVCRFENPWRCIHMCTRVSGGCVTMDMCANAMVHGGVCGHMCAWGCLCVHAGWGRHA